jgi:hypothetical protein
MDFPSSFFRLHYRMTNHLTEVATEVLHTTLLRTRSRARCNPSAFHRRILSSTDETIRGPTVPKFGLRHGKKAMRERSQKCVSERRGAYQKSQYTLVMMLHRKRCLMNAPLQNKLRFSLERSVLGNLACWNALMNNVSTCIMYERWMVAQEMKVAVLHGVRCFRKGPT